MARAHPPSFDFYPDDFIGGTLGMHPCARGIYISLLCHQWSHGSMNLTNNRQLVQITGAMPDELNQHLPEVLLKFEQLENGEFQNVRLEREYTRKMEICRKRAESGGLGGKSSAIAKQMLEQKGSNRKANLEVGSRKKEVFKIENECLPFSSDRFVQALRDFLAMRAEKGKPVAPTGGRATLKKLAAMGEDRAVAALEHTTANEWQGIREPEASAAAVAGVRHSATFAQQREANMQAAGDRFIAGATE